MFRASSAIGSWPYLFTCDFGARYLSNAFTIEMIKGSLDKHFIVHEDSTNLYPLLKVWIAHFLKLKNANRGSRGLPLIHQLPLKPDHNLYTLYFNDLKGFSIPEGSP